MKKPYRVSVETTGCKCCGGGTFWSVVGPGEVSLATSYADKEDAEFLRDMCNMAYLAGMDKGLKKTVPGPGDELRYAAQIADLYRQDGRGTKR